MALEIAALVLLIVGLACCWLALAGLRRRKVARGVLSGMTGLALLAAAAAAMLLASNLHTYARLTHETDAGEIRFRQLGSDRYRAELVLAPSDPARLPSSRSFDLQGQEWQLDARIIKWHGIANLLGLDALYRMDRLSGRYRSADEELQRPRSVYPLSENPGLDLWSLAQRHGTWLGLVDASYGSATYLPMADGAIYSLHVSQSGLLARPVNEAAREAVGAWR